MATKRGPRVEHEGLHALNAIIKSAGQTRPVAPCETALSERDRHALSVQARLSSARMRLRVTAVPVGGESFPLV